MPDTSPPRTRPHRVGYDDVVADIRTTVVGLAERAAALGVRRDAILIDPGHDFGKNSRHSLEATRRLPELVDTGWPVLVAMSNKDFLGEIFDLPVDRPVRADHGGHGHRGLARRPGGAGPFRAGHPARHRDRKGHRRAPAIWLSEGAHWRDFRALHSPNLNRTSCRRNGTDA